jgi:hypothetical protein
MGDMAFYMAALPIAFHALGPRMGAGLLASLMAAAAVTDFLKYALNLPRPPEELWLVEAEGPGFPSGHASTTASFWGYLALATRSLALYAAAVGLPGLVGASRIELNVHYPQDVAGGLVIGYAAAGAAYLAARRLEPKALLAAVALAAILLEVPSAARFEVASTPLGAAAGIAVYERLVGGGPLGAGYGVLGSAAALALGAPALIYESPLVGAASTMAAGFAAITVPAVLARLRGAGEKRGRD